MLFNKQRLGAIILFLSDIVILSAIFLLSVFLRKFLASISPSFPIFDISYFDYSWFFLIWIVILVYEGGYTRKFTFWDEVKFLWTVTFFSTLTILTIVSLGKLISVSRAFILVIGVLSLVIFPVLRLALKRKLIQSGMLKNRVLILGIGETGRRTLYALRREPNLGYDVAGFIDENRSKTFQCIDGIKVHGHFEQIERYVKNCDIQDVVIATENIDKRDIAHLVNKLQHKVRNVLYMPDFSGMAVIGTEVRHFFHDQLFAVEIINNLAQPINIFIKKIFDYTVGFVLFFLLIVPLLVIAVLIRMTSQGPAILKQERIGKNCELFTCYKFRTMYIDADERLKAILLTDPAAMAEWQTYWKLKNDPRITKIGSFLRKTSLDELPQIWNVLKGEMSIVGPRPYLQREWDLLKDYSEIIHSVHPGITGLWQVSGRNVTSNEQRLSIDSWYVRNWNVWLDIVILLKTFKVLFKQEGAW